MYKSVIAVVWVLSLAGAVQGATIRVRQDGTGDYTTIQPAVDAASPGDTIDIGPGEYTEYQTIRPPQWDWDIDIYVYVTTDNLTIVGAGVDETIIGPAQEDIDYQHFSPECIWAGNVEHLDVSGLTVRNCHTGLYGSTVSNRVENMRFSMVNICVIIFGQTAEVESCEFVGTGNSTKAVAHTPNCSYSRISNCNILGCSIYLETVEDFAISDCVCNGGQSAIAVLDWSVGTIERCTVNNTVNVGFNIDTSRCTMNDVQLTGGRGGVWVQGGELYANGVTIRETTYDSFFAVEPVALVVHGSNILPLSGYAVRLESGSDTPSSVYDFTGNYWGLTDSTAIAELIRDANDSQWVNDYVDFVPFEAQLGVQRTTMGSIKALFRDATK